MDYLLAFLEGIITFISPCLLPMVPIYLAYIGGGAEDGSETQGQSAQRLMRAGCFVLGFSAVFVLLGAFAGTLGRLLLRYQTVVNIGSGILVILFGLSYLEVLRLPFAKGITSRAEPVRSAAGAVLFGMVFSVGWTPCVGAFLGSALMLASAGASMWRGVLLLLCYSVGLGIPFLLSALLLSRLNAAFQFIKKHYAVINRVCGIFLIAVGLLMATGWMSRWLAALSWVFSA